MKASFLSIVVVAVCALGLLTVPAEAGGRKYHYHGWNHGSGYHYGGRGYYGPRFYRPYSRPIYYYPPPVYYGPAPVFVFGFGFH